MGKNKVYDGSVVNNEVAYQVEGYFLQSNRNETHIDSSNADSVYFKSIKAKTKEIYSLVVQQLALVTDEDYQITPSSEAKKIADELLGDLIEHEWDIDGIGATSDNGVFIKCNKLKLEYSFDVYGDGDIILMDMHNPPSQKNLQELKKLIYALS